MNVAALSVAESEGMEIDLTEDVSRLVDCAVRAYFDHLVEAVTLEGSAIEILEKARAPEAP